jgi:hypothetical protein
MGTGTVRTSVEQYVRRWRVLVPHRDVWDVATGEGAPLFILIFVVLLGVLLTACAPISRLRPYDPEKDFAYGQIEHREPGDAMVVTRATLEAHGDDRHALVIDETVDGALPICVEQPAARQGGERRQACTTIETVRLLIEAANARIQ